jgi:hypothetical protein
MWRFLAIVVVALSSQSKAFAQDCPKNDPNGPSIPSSVQQFEGFVEYHDSIRQWSDLRLHSPVCGSRKIQLLDDDVGNTAAISRYRNCRVRVSGKLDIPGTVYYSESLFLVVESVRSIGVCVLKRSLPVQFSGSPGSNTNRYRVTMRIDYRPHGGPVAVTVRSGYKSLTPWQKYASYMLTGGFVFYGRCADDFSMSNVSATREAYLGVTDDVAALDPETAAIKHVRILHLSFTCSRSTEESSN